MTDELLKQADEALKHGFQCVTLDEMLTEAFDLIKALSTKVREQEEGYARLHRTYLLVLQDNEEAKST